LFTWRYELNTLAWAILIVVTSMLLKKVGQLLRLWLMGSRLPGPPLQTLVARSVNCAKADGPLKLLELFSTLHKEHGPVLKIWMGPTQLLVSIFDARIVNEVLEKAKDRVSTSQMALELAFGKGSLFFAPFSKVERQCAMYDREINGNLLAEVHAISHKVIQKLDLWAKPGQDGNWETDSNSCSQNMAFAVLGISIFGEGYVDWAVARKFEKLLVSIADEIPRWIRYTMPPVWRLSFIRFWRKCDQLKHLTESLVTEAQKVQSKLHQTDNPNNTDGTTFKSKRSKGSLDGKYKNKEVCGITDAVTSNLVNKKILGEGRVGAMMYHGGFTTAGILSGVLTQLAHHPEIQAKVCCREIRALEHSTLVPCKSVNETIFKI
jgi:hypothetical protein